jgi:hypothetical protein
MLWRVSGAGDAGFSGGANGAGIGLDAGETLARGRDVEVEGTVVPMVQVPVQPTVSV